MIGRVKFLERYGLSSEVETGQWVISDRAEVTLKELSDRNDIIKTMHRALATPRVGRGARGRPIRPPR